MFLYTFSAIIIRNGRCRCPWNIDHVALLLKTLHCDLSYLELNLKHFHGLYTLIWMGLSGYFSIPFPTTFTPVCYFSPMELWFSSIILSSYQRCGILICLLFSWVWMLSIQIMTWFLNWCRHIFRVHISPHGGFPNLSNIIQQHLLSTWHWRTCVCLSEFSVSCLSKSFVEATLNA